MMSAPAGSCEADTRVVIVDDHQLLAQALGLALGRDGVACHVPRLGSTEELLAEISAIGPDLVLLDLELGGEIGDGSDLVTPLILLGARVIVVTASKDDDVLARTLASGASGIIDKELPFGDLCDAVAAASRGEELMSPLARGQILDGARRRRVERSRALEPFRRLTEREAQVLRHLADGVPVGSIARRWLVSEATVRSHVRGILTKLGVGSQLEAVAVAHRSDWL